MNSFQTAKIYRLAAWLLTFPSGGADRSTEKSADVPDPGKWLCVSINPGSIVLPCKSTTAVLELAIFRMSALVPTAAMRSPRTATA